MMKNIKISVSLFLSVLFVLFLFSSCKKEIVINDPTPVYDKGERLMLSNNLVILDNSELTHSGGQQGASYDEATQVLKFDEAGIKEELETDLDTGMVLLIKRDGDVLLRKITKVNKASGRYELQTSPGSISHVFDRAHLNFDFSPEYSNEQLQTKSLSNLDSEELSAALTDKDNRVHPSEITMIIGGKKELLFSVNKEKALVKTKSANSGTSVKDNKIGFTHTFKDPFSIPLKGPIELKLEDFGFSWYSNLTAEYSKDIGLKSQSASFNVIATNMDIEAWFDAALVAEGEAPLVNDNSNLLLPIQIAFTFPVATVPVNIAIEFALDLGTEITLDGKARISSGYTLKYNIPRFEIGAHAHHWGFSGWSAGPDYHYEEGHITDHHFNPLTIEAMATLTQVYTLKPTMGFAIYSIVGPEVNMAIGMEYDFSVGAGAKFDVQGDKAPEAYIGWGANLSSRIGIGGGAWIDVGGLVNKHWDIPTLPVLPNIPIWHTPQSMENKTDNDFGQTVIGEPKEVEVEVKDSWTLPAPAMFVEWVSDGGGYWELPITMTGLGTTKNTWHPTKSGDYKPYCYVKNGTLKEVDRVTFTTNTVAK